MVAVVQLARKLAAWPENVRVFAAALLALGLIAIGRAFSNGGGASVAVVGAIGVVGVLPGYVVCSALFANGRTLAWPIRWMLAVGFSLFVVNCACMAGLMLHLSMHVMATLIPALVMIGCLAVAVLRKSPGPSGDGSGNPPLHVAALAVWALTGLAAFLVGHNDIDGQLENLFAIGIVDALRTAVRPQDAYFVSDVSPVYPFPVIHYAYALVAEMSGTTSVFAFEKMRGLWTLTALSTIFVGVRAFSASEQGAYLALLGSSFLLIGGQFGAVPGFYWGQLAPTSHPADVAMNVLVPIALASLFLWMSSDGRGRRELLVLFVCIAAILANIHQRELFQILIYAACSLLFLRDRRSLIGLGLTICVSVCAALAARWWLVSNAPGIGDLLAATRQTLASEFAGLSFQTMFHRFDRLVVNYDGPLLTGLNGLMMAMSAGVFLVLRRSVPVRVAGLVFAGFMLVASFSVLSIPALWITYDELLFTPIRHVIFILYCLFWTAICVLLAQSNSLERSGKSLAIPIAVGIASGISLAGAAAFLQRGYIPPEMLVLATVVCGLIAGSVPPRNVAAVAVPNCKRNGSIGPALILSLAVLTAAPSHALLTRILEGSVALTPTQALMSVYRRHVANVSGVPVDECKPRKVLLIGHELDQQACMPPEDVIEWLSSHLPRDGVLLVNPAGDFVGTGVLPIKLAAPVRPDQYFRNWEIAFSRFYQVVRQGFADRNELPVFATNGEPEQRYRDARALGATHLLVDPPLRSAFLAAISKRPDLFGLAMDRSQWLLVEIRISGNS